VHHTVHGKDPALDSSTSFARLRMTPKRIKNHVSSEFPRRNSENHLDIHDYSLENNLIIYALFYIICSSLKKHFASFMKKITDIFAEKKQTFSFEVFPPKTDEGYTKLKATIGELCSLSPDFISCTYGAGGGNRDKTLDIAQYIQDVHHTVSMAHLTCVLNSRDDILHIVKNIQDRGIANVLALRGDPPQECPDWQPGVDNFPYCKDLCAFITKNFGPSVCVGVAGFPEGHLTCPDKELDADRLKMKIANGAGFVVTQLFFDNQFYFDYVARLRTRGVTCPVVPGILPITNYQGMLKFVERCGTTVPRGVKEIFEPIQDDPEKVLEAGIRFAIDQCQDLLKNGAPGVHLYSLNKLHPVDEIVKALRG